MVKIVTAKIKLGYRFLDHPVYHYPSTTYRATESQPVMRLVSRRWSQLSYEHYDQTDMRLYRYISRIWYPVFDCPFFSPRSAFP